MNYDGEEISALDFALGIILLICSGLAVIVIPTFLLLCGAILLGII